MTLKQVIDKLLEELDQHINLDDFVKVCELGSDDIRDISSIEYRGNQLVIVMEN